MVIVDESKGFYMNNFNGVVLDTTEENIFLTGINSDGSREVIFNVTKYIKEYRESTERALKNSQADTAENIGYLYDMHFMESCYVKALSEQIFGLKDGSPLLISSINETFEDKVNNVLDF